MRFYIILFHIYTIFLIHGKTASVNWCDYDCSGNYKNVVCRRGVVCPPSETCREVQDFTDEIKEIILDEHNKYRSLIALGKENSIPINLRQASNMMAISWNKELEMAAKCHVMQCTNNADPWCRTTPSYAEFGQNIAAFPTTKEHCNSSEFVEKVMNLWKTQHRDIALDQPNQNEDFSDYYQLIWAKTTHLGCFASQKPVGSNQTMCFIACNYASNNLIKDDGIYIQGKPCSECPRGELCNPLYEGLCGNNYGPNGNIAKVLSTGKFETTTNEISNGKNLKPNDIFWKRELYKPPGFKIKHPLKSKDKNGDEVRYLVFNEFGNFKFYDKSNQSLKIDTKVTYWSPVLPMYDYLEDIVFEPLKNLRTRSKSYKKNRHRFDEDKAIEMEKLFGKSDNGVKKRSKKVLRNRRKRQEHMKRYRTASNSESIYDHDFERLRMPYGEMLPKSTYIVRKSQLNPHYSEKRRIMNSSRQKNFDRHKNKRRQNYTNDFLIKRHANFGISNSKTDNVDQNTAVRKNSHRSKLYTFDKVPLWIRSFGFFDKTNRRSQNDHAEPQAKLEGNKKTVFNEESVVKDIIKVLLESSVENLNQNNTRREAETKILNDILNEITNETDLEINRLNLPKSTEIIRGKALASDTSYHNPSDLAQSDGTKSNTGSSQKLTEAKTSTDPQMTILNDSTNVETLRTTTKPVQYLITQTNSREEYDDSDVVYSILQSMMDEEEAKDIEMLNNSTNNNETRGLIDEKEYLEITGHEMDPFINLTDVNIAIAENPITQTFGGVNITTSSDKSGENQTNSTQVTAPQSVLIVLDTDDILKLNGKKLSNIEVDTDKNRTESNITTSKGIMDFINDSSSLTTRINLQNEYCITCNNSSLKNEVDNVTHSHLDTRQSSLEKKITNKEARKQVANDLDIISGGLFTVINQTADVVDTSDIFTLIGRKNYKPTYKTDESKANLGNTSSNIWSDKIAFHNNSTSIQNVAQYGRNQVKNNNGTHFLNLMGNAAEEVAADNKGNQYTSDKRENGDLKASKVRNNTINDEIRIVQKNQAQNKENDDNLFQRFLRNMENFIGN